MSIMSIPGELPPDKETVAFPRGGDADEPTVRFLPGLPGEKTVRLTPHATSDSEEITTVIPVAGSPEDDTVRLSSVDSGEKTVAIPEKMREKVGNVSLLKDRVRAELSDTLDRPSYYNQLSSVPPDWNKFDAAATSYIATYWDVRSRIIPQGTPETDITLEERTLAMLYDVHTLGTTDGSTFRRVVMGLAPAARVDVRKLSLAEDFPSIQTDPLDLSIIHEARVGGGLPNVGFVAPFGDEYATDGTIPGYAYNLEAIQMIAETHRDIFDRLGFTEADPAELATAVFSSRTLAAGKNTPAHSVIATNLLLGHSLGDILFSNLEHRFHNGQPNNWESTALLNEAQQILTEAQVTLLHKVIEAPGSAQALGLTDNAAIAETYDQHRTLHELVWDNTALAGFLFHRRLDLTGELYSPNPQYPEQDWFRTY